MQLIYPQVWDEDGVNTLYLLINRGWISILYPPNGYLIVLPKMISAISLWISFSHYPTISTIITWLFIAFVGLAIALAPTSLRSKLLCAVAVFLIPSDPEVFGIPLYTFWWAGILLFLLALWDEKDSSLGWRLAFLILGGLSSPYIVMILPIFYFRAYWYRNSRNEKVLAIIATVIAAIQGYFLLTSAAKQFPPFTSLLINVIPTFFGKFLIGNWNDVYILLLFAGLILIGIIAMWLLNNRSNVSSWILLYLLIGTIAFTVIRVDPAALDPRLAGPRYFFYQFILLFWILIQFLSTTGKKWLRVGVIVVILVVLINATPVWSRPQDDLNWETHVTSSTLFPSYTIPIQYDGNKSDVWYVTLPGEKCAELLSHDLLFSQNEINESPTYPCTLLFNRNKTRENIKVLNNTMAGTGSPGSRLEDYRVISSFDTSDADTGIVTLKLHRGDQIFYHSGPGNGGLKVIIVGHEQEFRTDLPITTDYWGRLEYWQTLDFSNAKLPDDFTAIFEDNGTGYGEWFAIAVPD